MATSDGSAEQPPEERAASRTTLDEPLRPTLDDRDDERTTEQLTATDELATEELPTRELAPVAGPRRSGRGVYFLVGGLLLAAVVGPLIFWLAFWRFQPTAQHHVPAGTVLAVRVDARELFLFAPFRQHVLPVLAPATTDPTRPTRLARIATHTGVDLTRDVREIVLATTDGARWAVLLGGRFQSSARRAPFVDGFEQAMEAEAEAFDWQRRGDVLVGPAGASVAQAEDGTILFTSTEDVARAARHATDDYRELWLSSAGDVSFSVTSAALAHVASAQRGEVPEMAVLARAERITGWIHLDAHESEITLDVVPRSGEAIEPFAADVEAMIRALARRAEAPPAEGAVSAGAVLAPSARALAAKVLGGAKVQTRAASVLVTSVAPGEMLDAALRDVARSHPGAAPP